MLFWFVFDVVGVVDLVVWFVVLIDGVVCDWVMLFV